MSMTKKQIDACVQKWTKADRNEVVPDQPISADQLDDWAQWCEEGKQSKKWARAARQALGPVG